VFRLEVTAARAAVTSLLAVAAMRAGTVDQLWPEADVYIKTSARTDLYFLASGTRTEEVGRTGIQAGANMDFFFARILADREYRRRDLAKSRAVMLRVGYLWDKTVPNVKVPYTAHTGVVAITSRYYLPRKTLVTDRNEGDLRFQNGQFMPRYRNRLRLERAFGTGPLAIVPYASAEASYDTRYDCFYRMRYVAGAEVEFKRFVIEPYFLRQQDSQPRFISTDVLGLTLQLHFR